MFAAVVAAVAFVEEGEDVEVGFHAGGFAAVEVGGEDFFQEGGVPGGVQEGGGVPYGGQFRRTRYDFVGVRFVILNQ